MPTLADAVGSWKPVDYSGSGDLLDSSGGGRDATILGSPTFTDPYFDMDGVDDTFRIDDDAVFDFAATDDFALVFVGYITGTPSELHGGIVKKLSFNQGNLGYGLVVTANRSGRLFIDDGTTQTATAFPGANGLPINTIFSSP